MTHRTLPAAVLGALCALGGVASADLSHGVSSAFSGQIVVSKDELASAKDDRGTIAKAKEVRLKEVVGEPKDDVTYWHFHYTAFLSRTGSANLKLEFITDDKDKRYAADQSLEGVDPKSNVLSGDISIDEDQGLAKGKSYIVKLENDKGQTVATTSLVMK